MEEKYNIKYIDRENNQEMVIPLEKMVGICLSLENNFDFHIEALKAQAVIIRTNLLKHQKPVEGNGLKDILEDNEWSEKVIKAVEETKGKVITFNGKVIDAKYHLVCGGSTENSENVIDNQVIYLRRVLCDYCKDSPYWSREKYFDIDELKSLLKVRFPEAKIDNSPEISGFLEKIEKDEYGRVKSIKIGDKVFSGVELSKLLNLDSTRFSIFPTGVKFVSRGKGHGLGLCLYGANMMANEGYSFEEILKYYYTGVEIKKIELPCIKKPLFGKIIVFDPGHGGEDIGFKGDYLGLLEKNITLKLALKLKPKLENLGAKVYLTRESDTKVLATHRLEQANKINPDFFISIHMDYYSHSNMKGLEMFHFRNDEESRKLGLCILNSLKKKNIRTRGIKEGNYFAFRGIGVSSLIIEAGFLSERDEEANFQDDNYIEELTDGIVEGIIEYFDV